MVKVCNLPNFRSDALSRVSDSRHDVSFSVLLLLERRTLDTIVSHRAVKM